MATPGIYRPQIVSIQYSSPYPFSARNERPDIQQLEQTIIKVMEALQYHHILTAGHENGDAVLDFGDDSERKEW